MTAPVKTSLFQTPTMSFGEVGVTAETEAGDYSSDAAGVGKFEETKVLERMALIQEMDWSTSDTGVLFNTNILANLIGNVERNAQVLDQFQFERFDIEATVRLNTNQFYYGELAVTMFPTTATGFRVDERMVLAPTSIDASCADSVIKTWNYSWPDAWMNLTKAQSGQYPVTLSLDILCPLTTSSANMPDHITVQLWARLKNVKLAYPISDGPVRARKGRFKGWNDGKTFAQSGVAVKRVPRKSTKHPLDSTNIVGEAMDAISTMSIGDGIGLAMDLLPALGFVLDKPDEPAPQDSFQNEPMKDAFLVNTKDQNVSLSVYGNYVDPSMRRMPQSGGFTVSKYAQIPGLRQPFLTFTNQDTDGQVVQLMQVHPDNSTYKIPLDYAFLNSMQWRGSLKVMLKFVTSSFISARFAVQYINQDEAAPVFPGEYDSGISKVVDVKGPTIDTFTLPWLRSKYWDNSNGPLIKISAISEIANTDSTAEPKIYCLVWVAGGEDIQFAYPTVVQPQDWSAADPSGEVKRRTVRSPFIPNSSDEAQTSVGELFTKSFPPLGENCEYQPEHSWCTGEELLEITDLCKRHSAVFVNSLATPQPSIGITPTLRDFTGRSVTTDPISQQYSDWIAFRSTLFGCWRQAFLFCSGGMKYRAKDTSGGVHGWFPTMQQNAVSTSAVAGTFYVSAPDGWTRLTIPQVSNQPFGVLSVNPAGDGNFQMGLTHDSTSTIPTSGFWQFISARDDVQFGFPILPAGMVPPGSSAKKQARFAKNNVDLRRSTARAKGSLHALD